MKVEYFFLKKNRQKDKPKSRVTAVQLNIKSQVYTEAYMILQSGSHLYFASASYLFSAAFFPGSIAKIIFV